MKRRDTWTFKVSLNILFSVNCVIGLQLLTILHTTLLITSVSHYSNQNVSLIKFSRNLSQMQSLTMLSLTFLLRSFEARTSLWKIISTLCIWHKLQITSLNLTPMLLKNLLWIYAIGPRLKLNSTAFVVWWYNIFV